MFLNAAVFVYLCLLMFVVLLFFSFSRLNCSQRLLIILICFENDGIFTVNLLRFRL